MPVDRALYTDDYTGPQFEDADIAHLCNGDQGLYGFLIFYDYIPETQKIFYIHVPLQLLFCNEKRRIQGPMLYCFHVERGHFTARNGYRGNSYAILWSLGFDANSHMPGPLQKNTNSGSIHHARAEKGFALMQSLLDNFPERY